jgi:probable aminopeptidase NPEPL1
LIYDGVGVPDLSKVGVTGELNSTLMEVATKKLSKSAESVRPKDTHTMTTLMTVEGNRLCLAVLPTSCARHNTPTQSHGVTVCVAAAALGNTCTIILRPIDASYALAQGVAVSRAFYLHSMKTAWTTAPADCNVTVLMDCSMTAAALAELQYCADGVRGCAALVDTPPNVLHTDAYVAECTKVVDEITPVATARGDTVRFEAIQGEELEKRGFGGLWGVGKASEHLPSLVIMSYTPAGAGADDKSICLVGKGIVYDTGGLSIKSKDGMPGMKTDMGGSAAVLYSFQALVRRGASRKVHAIMCISENSVGPLATRPDDVHVFLSGKTVEVNNTDAEGRLVLADGCFYATATLNPSHIVDIATLTGAQGIATGFRHAAVYCNDDDFEDTAVRVGKSTGDLVHPLPYCPEFFKLEYASKVADMKNSVANRANAQCSCAAQFIGNHIETWLDDGGKWCHVDMAYPSGSAGRATGYGVALLMKLVDAIA